MSSGGKVRKPNYDNFMETYSSWWDINRAIIEDNSNDGFDYSRVQSDNGGDVPTQDNLTFRMQTQGNRYLVPAESYFEMEFDIVRINGAAYTALNDQFITYDGGNQFLFSQISYYIGEREVERKTQADVAEVLKKLLNSPYTKQNKSNFRIETGTAADTLNAASATVQGSVFNKAVYHKFNRKNNPKVADLKHKIRIPLKEMFEIHEYYPIAWYGQEHQIRIQLHPRNAGNVLHRGTPAPDENGKVKIEKLVLWNATVRPSESMSKQLLEMRNDEKEHLMQWEACNIFQKNFSSPTDINWRITDASTRVQRVVIMIRKQTALSTQKSVNSHIVPSAHRPTSAYLTYNGHKIPQIDFSTDANTTYIRLYHEYLRCAGKGKNSMDSVALTYDEFVNNYCLICFDLSQLSKEMQSFGSLATLDFSGSFNGAGDVVVTAAVFQDRYMTTVLGKSAQLVNNVRGLY